MLDGIQAYNEEDCRSTFELHGWLLSWRPPNLPWLLPPDERERTEEAEERDAARVALHEALLDGAEEGDPRWLLAHLLYYHQREAKSQWWEWFHHLELDEDDLIEDTDTMGGLVLVGDPVEDGQSLVYTFTFPPQEHKIDGYSVDPKTENGYVVATDDELGTVTFKRGKARADELLPEALIPPRPIPDWNHRDSVERFARWYLEGEASLAPTTSLTPWSRSSSAGRHGPGLMRRWRRPRCRSTAAISSSRALRARERRGRARRRRSRSERGPPGRCHVTEPQGDLEAPRRDRARGARAGVSFKGRKKSSGEDTRYEARSSIRVTAGATCWTTSSSSSRARRGSSRAPTSPASSTR